MKIIREFEPDAPIKNSKIMFPAPTFTNTNMVLEGTMGDRLKLRTYEKDTGQNTSEVIIEFGNNEGKIIAPYDFSITTNRVGNGLNIGDYYQTKRIFNNDDLEIYYRLTGINPQNTNSQKQLIPEPLINGEFSTILGINLPGMGTNYLKQETQYFQPAQLGQEIFTRVEITNLRPDKKLVDLETICMDKDGNLIAIGRALVSARDVMGAFAE